MCVVLTAIIIRFQGIYIHCFFNSEGKLFWHMVYSAH